MYAIGSIGNTYQSLLPVNPDFELIQLFGFIIDGKSLHNSWVPFQMKFGSKAKHMKVGDIFSTYYTTGSLPIFSNKSVQFLSNLLEPYGELLPVYAYGEVYYIYNCTTLKSLNEIKEENFGDIFKLTSAPFYNKVIVSQNFLDIIKKNKLKGFNFETFDTSIVY